MGKRQYVRSELQYSRSELINTCYDIAEYAFREKTDLAGQPYLGHLTRVESKVSELGDVARATALLHDLLEDCDEWSQLSLRIALALHNDTGKIVVDRVLLLTHNKEELTYEEYITRLINSNDIVALAIKKADLEDNMDITRLLFLTDKDIRRLIKYHTAWLRISAAIENLEKIKNHEHN